MDTSTAIVFGHGRSGTSLITYILARLGYSLMNQAHPLKHESTPIVVNDDGTFNEHETTKAIQSLNKQFSHWVFKSPGSIFLLSKFFHKLRNPTIFIIHRNPIDMINSACTKEHLWAEVYFRDYSVVYNCIANLIETAPCHIEHLSFEKLKENPYPVICRLSDQYGFPFNDKLFREISESVAKKGYKHLTQHNRDIKISDLDLMGDSRQAFNRVLIPWLVRKLSFLQSILIDTITALLILERQTSFLVYHKRLVDNVDLDFLSFCISFLNNNLPVFSSALIANLNNHNIADSAFKDTFPRTSEVVYSSCANGYVTFDYDFSQSSSIEIYTAVSSIWAKLITLRVKCQRELDDI